MSPVRTSKFFARLLLSRNPTRRQSSYTWLGKRMAALCDIADGLYNLFTPKNHWSRLSMNFVCWSATTSIEERLHER